MISSLITHVVVQFGAACKGGSFLGFPKWYKYLNGHTVGEGIPGAGSCAPIITNINDIWLVVAAIVEIMLRVAGLLAILYVIWGGVQYIQSQGDPGKTTQARQTLTNALIGLVIAVGATAMVTFIAGRFN
jgi:hypothetical protein